MHITVLAGGVGAARFLTGLVAAHPEADITVIGNTADDIWLHGLKICPDLDTVMYTLGGGIHPDQGWGRAGETFSVTAELTAYGTPGLWFTLGDRDFATHIVRSQMLAAGYPLSAVTEALCRRWQPGVRLLPMTDERVETHVVTELDGKPVAMHFQQWWVQHRAAPVPEQFRFIGIDDARPAPGVLAAIADADLIILPPSNPVVSLGPILAVPGIREAVAAAPAPVAGVSPIVAGAPIKGMADICLRAVGVDVSPAGVASMFADLLDVFVVDQRDGTGLPMRTVITDTVMATPEIATDLARTVVSEGLR